MKTLGQILREARLRNGFVMRELAALADLDAALISKFEKGNRIPTESNLEMLGKTLELDTIELRKQWMVEKVVEVVKYEPIANDVLLAAESRVEYLRSKDSLVVPELSQSIVNMLDEVDILKSRWVESKPLNKTQLRKMREFFHIEYTFESNRIEGNTLTMQETHLVVHEGLTIGGKSMQEHLEAVNHAEAIEYVEKLVSDKISVSKRVLLELHYFILKGIDRENAGRYRNVPVRIGGSEHVPPQPYLLDKLMEDYFLHYEKQKRQLHPIVLAAEMHERLVSIHPFIDGNGRTSRLVMNLILLQNGYTIANLKGDYDSRMQYYKALESVQVDNNPDSFYELVLEAELESLKAHLELV